MHTIKIPLSITVNDLESLPEDFRYELHDERQPDVAVFKNPPDKSRRFFPPSDFLILVEVVSKSTQGQDRILKPLHYADAGIPEYWRVERDPDDDDNAFIHRHKLSAKGKKYVTTDVVTLIDLEKGSQK
jgi:Uma2 family endonuclease